MKLNTYQKVALTTVGGTIFLIFVGGLVRASGAGLGCPDWPKCFGMWIPPLSASELPSGFNESQFNVFKTWTEYINRVIGVIIGFLITATFLLSFNYRKIKPAVFYSSGAAFLLVLIQGWLGGQVVISGLSEWLITLHMLLAMLIMMTLIYAAFKASADNFEVNISPWVSRAIYITTIVLIVSTFFQLIFGTQVREGIDVLKNLSDSPPRETWIARVGLIDEVHRTFSWLVLGAASVLFYLTGWRTPTKKLRYLGRVIFGLILLQMLTGVGLYYLSLPPAYQVVHLTSVAILIASEFLMILLIMNSNDALFFNLTLIKKADQK